MGSFLYALLYAWESGRYILSMAILFRPGDSVHQGQGNVVSTRVSIDHFHIRNFVLL